MLVGWGLKYVCTLLVDTPPVQNMECAPSLQAGQGCAYQPGGGGGIMRPTHPPWGLGNPKNPELSHPPPEGWTANHPPTHPATKAVQKTRALDQFSEISDDFAAYEQSVQCRHCLSHMMNRRSLSHLKSFLKVRYIEPHYFNGFHGLGPCRMIEEAGSLMLVGEAMRAEGKGVRPPCHSSRGAGGLASTVLDGREVEGVPYIKMVSN